MKDRQLLKQDVFEGPTECDAHLVKHIRGKDVETVKLVGALSRMWKENPVAFSDKEVQKFCCQYFGDNIKMKDLPKKLDSFTSLGLLTNYKRDWAIVREVKKVSQLDCVLKHRPDGRADDVDESSDESDYESIVARLFLMEALVFTKKRRVLKKVRKRVSCLSSAGRFSANPWFSWASCC